MTHPVLSNPMRQLWRQIKPLDRLEADQSRPFSHSPPYGSVKYKAPKCFGWSFARFARLRGINKYDLEFCRRQPKPQRFSTAPARLSGSSKSGRWIPYCPGDLIAYGSRQSPVLPPRELVAPFSMRPGGRKLQKLRYKKDFYNPWHATTRGAR